MKFSIFFTLISALFLSACGGISESPEPEHALVSIGLTDSPVLNASNVHIYIEAVELLNDEDFTWQRININRKIDVLALRGGNRTMLLNNFAITPQSYSSSRLILDPSRSDITIDGSTYPLTIPDGIDASPLVSFDYNLDTGDNLDITIDFNLRASIDNISQNSYTLRPVLRTTNMQFSSTISGTVSSVYANDSECSVDQDTRRAVYLFKNHNSLPQDIEHSNGDPIAIANVALNSSSNTYHYTLGFIPHGEYTISFTCRAQSDNSADQANGTLNFLGTANLSVTGSTFIHNIIAN